MNNWVRALGRPAKRLAVGSWNWWQRCREGRIIRQFNRLYYDGPHGAGKLFFQIEWLGVKTLKCPLDLWVYQEILFRTRPEVIVETGIAHGGSALYLASICELLGIGKIVSVDITFRRLDPRARQHPRIEFLEGSSTAPEIHRIIESHCRHRRTMVILDSNHQADHVREELRLYAPLVTPGCYLICEDTNINGHPVCPEFGPGPYEAVQDFLAENPQWKVDPRCEKLLMTFNPSGYLLRAA